MDDFEAYNINGRLLLQPSDDLTLDLKARVGEAEGGSIAFNAVFALPDLAAAFDAGFPNFGFDLLNEDVNSHNFVFQGNIDPQNDQEALELSAKLDYSKDWGSVTAWVLYSDIENSLSADGTSGAFGFFYGESNCMDTVAALREAGHSLPAPQFWGFDDGTNFFNAAVLGPYTPSTCDGTQYQERNQEDLSLEFRVASPADQPFRWLAGFYYLTLDREVGVNLGIDEGVGVTERLFVPAGSPNPTEQLLWDSFETDVYAFFGQLAYDLSEAVELSVALRYDRESRDASSLVPTDARTQYLDFNPVDGYTGDAPINPALNPAINADGMISDKAADFDQLQPKLSATWDLTDNLTLFGSWGVGFKSGGFNSQGSEATVNGFYNAALNFPESNELDLVIKDRYNEETSSAFEVGFKSRIAGGRVSFDGALFHTTVDDMQFFEFLVGPFGLLRVVSNVDEVELLGFEIGVNAVVTDWFQVYGGFSGVDSEIKENTSRPVTVGNASPYTPEYTLNLAAELDLPVRDGIRFVGGAYLTWIGETWFHTMQNNQRTTLFDLLPAAPGIGMADYSTTRRDAYALLDLRLGLEGENWALTVFGKNVTDEEYLEEVLVAPEFGGSFIHPGTLARWGVEFNRSF